MKIFMDGYTINYRGTTTAIIGYAEMLAGNGHEIVLGHSEKSIDTDTGLVKKLGEKYELIKYRDTIELERYLIGLGVDASYFIKSGEIDERQTKEIPSWIHAVFPQSPKSCHGSRYAFVSEWLSDECSNGKIPWVPHIISLAENGSDLRKELGIPLDSVVLGALGGHDSFDIDFTKSVIADLVRENKNLYFLSLGITKFVDESRIKFIPPTTCNSFKRAFLNTCDAMIHGRSLGESFGLSCGEFALLGKPILTYAYSPQIAHHKQFGPLIHSYTNKRSLRRQILALDYTPNLQFAETVRETYSNAAVYKKFRSVFMTQNRTKKINILDEIKFLRRDMINLTKRKIRRLQRTRDSLF